MLGAGTPGRCWGVVLGATQLVLLGGGAFCVVLGATPLVLLGGSAFCIVLGATPLILLGEGAFCVVLSATLLILLGRKSAFLIVLHASYMRNDGCRVCTFARSTLHGTVWLLEIPGCTGYPVARPMPPKKVASGSVDA